MQILSIFRVTFFVLLNCYISTAVEVTLKNGKLDCSEEEALGQKVVACRGVPFAKPPVGPLRFKKPEPIGNWEGVKKATENPKLCMQINPESMMKMQEVKGKVDFNIEAEVEKLKKEKKVLGGALDLALQYKGLQQSEDCLYLNMFFPKQCKAGEKLVPLIFLHGGFFYAGGIGVKAFDGSYLAAHGCLLVVVPQYRLNVYGFLNGGTEDMPGNLGLRDQVAAIEFVNKNAESLGADPKSTTLYGFDAGGWSCGMCIYSPICKKHVKRFIMSSGGPLAPLMLLGETASFARFEKFAAAANCPLPKKKEGSEEPVKATKETLECLQKLTTDQINELHTKVLSSKKDIPYFPNEDVPYLGGNPFDNVKKDHYDGVDEVMITSNSNEAGLMVACGLHKEYPPLKGECQKLTLDQLMEKMKETAGSSGGSQMSQMQMMLPMMFRNVDKNNATAVRDRIMSLASDGMFLCLDLQFISGYCKNKHKNLYFLRFDIRPSKSCYAPWMHGSQHGDELQYMWGFPMRPENNDHYNAHEKKVSEFCMSSVANFARYGNPVKHMKIPWHPMHDKKRTHMLINEKEIKEHKKYPKNCCADINRYYGMGRSFLKNYKP